MAELCISTYLKVNMYITNYQTIAAVQFYGFERTSKGPVIFYGDWGRGNTLQYKISLKTPHPRLDGNFYKTVLNKPL